MTIVGRTFSELKSELEANGCEVVCSDYFIEYNRIVCKKDNFSFVLQYKKFYTYHLVINLFTDLGLNPPEDCLHVKKQEKEYLKRYDKKKEK